MDLTKIMVLADRILPYKIELESIYKAKLKVERYSTYQILTLYARYQQLILNQEQEALRIYDFLKTLMDRLVDIQDIKCRTCVVTQYRRRQSTASS